MKISREDRISRRNPAYSGSPKALRKFREECGMEEAPLVLGSTRVAVLRRKKGTAGGQVLVQRKVKSAAEQVAAAKHRERVEKLENQAARRRELSQRDSFKLAGNERTRTILGGSVVARTRGEQLAELHRHWTEQVAAGNLDAVAYLEAIEKQLDKL